MDRSFLLQKQVIDASRDFVCIRLATYEDKEEVAYLAQVFRGREGTLENTVFAMLSPDARKYLARTGRGPQWAFSDAVDMARSMRKFAAEYEPTDMQRSLPAMKNFRLALAVASADNMPLVVAVSDNSADRARLTEKLAMMAWSKELLGKCQFAPASNASDLAAAKIPGGSGICVIAPDTYGLTGKVLARFDAAETPDKLLQDLIGALALFKAPVKEAQTHIDTGNRTGVHWKTATPVTDPNGPPGR